MQQAKEYAEILGVQFTYATNGQQIIEFDFHTGQQRQIDRYPTPDELWARLHVQPEVAPHLLAPTSRTSGKALRYYQEIAINRVVEAIAGGRRRILLTMATGTGKTLVAFQICWKLWKSEWNAARAKRPPRILFLSDRNILVDDPKDKDFVPFGDARFKIEGGTVNKSREMYFAIYQSLAPTEGGAGRYSQYAPDFFDLIVVDECHRGSARDDSNWRDILEYFAPAYQIGMTATPRRDDNGNTYDYFGDPIYEYSLRQGIEDGFLAPYTVLRVVTDVDAFGWRPIVGQIDRYKREIPDQEYTTDDFDHVVALRARTEAIARHLTDFLAKSGNPYAKTIIFCTDQEHALEMQDALARLNPELMKRYPDYVCRVTADEGDIGRGHLDHFKDVERVSPVILTSSRLLTTGIDIPTCKNIVIARVIRSMTEFKQIIGRGTRVRDDYDKLFFNIIDYTGSATELFADPGFDGFPALEVLEHMDEDGRTIKDKVISDRDPTAPILDDVPLERRKLYVDEGAAEVIAEMVYELDENGKQIVVRYTDYAAERVRSLYPNSAAIRRQWADPFQRTRLIEHLAEQNIDFERLAAVTNQPDADPFDLLCHIAFNAPIRTRRERANRVRQEETAYFQSYTGPAREILLSLLEKYAEFGTMQFILKDILRVPPFTGYGNIIEIGKYFGGLDKLKQAVDQLQTLLYVA